MPSGFWPSLNEKEHSKAEIQCELFKHVAFIHFVRVWSHHLRPLSIIGFSTYLFKVPKTTKEQPHSSKHLAFFCSQLIPSDLLISEHYINGISSQKCLEPLLSLKNLYYRSPIMGWPLISLREGENEVVKQVVGSRWNVQNVVCWLFEHVSLSR